MGGMGTGLTSNDPTIVSAFHQELFRGFLVVLVIAALVGLCWNVMRSVLLRRAAAGGAVASGAHVRPRGERTGGATTTPHLLRDHLDL